MSSKNNLFKSAFLAVFGLFLSLVLTLISPASTFAKTKTYGYADKAKNYLYNQAANWWGDGDGSKKNGSGINAFAAAVSVLNDTRISPATIAELSFKGNIWNLSGAAPSDLIIRLAGDQSIGAEVMKSAAGSSVSVRLKAVAKTIQSGGVVVARATGSSPFNTGESGGHYIAIFGYKSDDKLYVYDPGKAKGSWVSGKSFIKKMKKDIMFYALGRGFGANVADIDFFSSASLADPDPETPASDDEPSSEDDDPAPEIDDCASNPSNPNCISDPSDDPSDSDTGIEPEGDQYFDDFSAEQLTGTSRAVFDDALSSAWPTIVETGSETASGTCYDSYGNPYTNYAADSGKCKASIKSELRTLLEATGLSSNLATAQSSSSFIGALLIKNNAISSLNKNNLTQSYLYELLNAGTNGWGRVDSPVSGDIVYYNSKFFYWIGDSGRNWGNAITAGDGWVPHIENVTLSGTYRVYRYGGGGTGGGDGGDYTLPPEYWDVAPGDQVAIRAMSYSWPYTRYSTDEESLWGSCVKKYETAVAKSSGEEALAMSLSKFPSTTAASLASKNLSKYPTGTKCNTTITPDYAKFKNITSTSKMNNYPVGSMSFVRNVFISLGVNINYLSISDLRKNAEQLTNFDLITKKADKNTELQPGDLLVAKDAAMIYVGDYGEAYGKVAQSYKGKWTPRLTPIYYNSTYVFRLKSSASVSEEGDCPELSMDSVEGNEKIAVAAANVAWPYRTGKGSEIGKCLNGSQLTTYPPAYTYKVSNTKLTTTNKKLSTLLKEIKATGCLGTARSSLSSLLSDAGLSNPKSDINYVYAALKAAGIKRFEVNTDLNNLSAATAFNNLKSDSENFTLVTKKLTSKNKSSLQRGDIIIASQTKNKKTYSKIMIYIGKYGKDCLGVNYGSVVDANSSAVPYVRPLSYYLNDSSSYMNYYVFRAKTSAYEEPVQQPEPEQPEQPEEPEEPEQPEEPTNPCPSNPNSSECAAYCQTNPDADGCGGLPHACDLLADSTECASYCSANPNAKECLGRKIAIKAVEFSWPYTKYSLQDDSGALKSLYGKCVGWGNKVISSYPNLNGKIRVKDENYAAINCGRVYTPLMLKYLAGASWSVTDIIAFDGAYNATMAKKGTKIYNLLTKKDSYRDCIGFANRVLKAAGASTGNLKAWAGGTIKGWTKIGYGVKMPSKENQKMPQKPNVLYIEETMPGYKNATLQPGDVVIRLGGRHCATLGKEESSYSGKKVCASHIMFYVGSFGGVYGNRVDSNGWLGAQSSGSNINTGAGYIHSLYMDDHIYGAGDGTIIYRYTGE